MAAYPVLGQPGAIAMQPGAIAMQPGGPGGPPPPAGWDSGAVAGPATSSPSDLGAVDPKMTMQALGGPPPPAGWDAGAVAGPAPPPSGLEYLAAVDQLLIKQKWEALEAFTGFETNNKYEILNVFGQRVFMAIEDTCCCTRGVCGKTRPFNINIMDNARKEIIHLERPLRSDSCFWFCCMQKMEVHAPKGNIIGLVRQAWSPFGIPKYNINNAQDETVLRIRGPCFRCSLCGDIKFKVTSPDGETDVGQISKQWSGLAKELFTDADNFGVTFPLDLDVKMKATLLGAVFLIDFMYSEKDREDTKKEVKQISS